MIYVSHADTPWYAFHLSYFMFVPSQLSFEDAKKYCRKKRGHLASTSNEEEYSFLHQTFIKNNPDGKC